MTHRKSGGGDGDGDGDGDNIENEALLDVLGHKIIK